MNEYVNNLRAMVGTGSKLPLTTVILMTPAVCEPVLEEGNRLKGRLFCEPYGGRTGKYANAVALGEELGLSVVDNFYAWIPPRHLESVLRGRTT